MRFFYIIQQSFCAILWCVAVAFPMGVMAAHPLSVVKPTVERRTCPEGIDVKEPRFSWQLASPKRNVMQRAYRIRVASSSRLLEEGKADMWDSGRVPTDACLYIPYQGKALQSNTRYYWQVEVVSTVGTAVSEPSSWLTGIMNPAEWQATWIGGRFATDVEKGRTRVNARYLRREFGIKGEVQQAVLHICGLGLYEAYINGQRVGNQVLAPTPTNYDRSVRYNTFDVTSMMQRGQNAIGVVLGNGRFMAMRNPGMRGFGLPRLLAQLVVTTTDGQQTIIPTDTSWHMMADGPIQSNNEFDGEVYDARKEMPGWNRAGFVMKGWRQATPVPAPAPLVEAQLNPNIRVMAQVKPLSVKPLSGGRYLIDMGQNMVGWLQVRLHGNEGDTLRLRFAERMSPTHPDSLFLANLRTAEVTDTYIAHGHPAVWEPSFTYHGFRFVEVTGFRHAPRLEDIVGQVVYDEMATTGSFTTSSDMLNRIYQCAYWGVRGNYRGMPTDCPQRDERLGWLGDRATGALGECFMFDNHHLYAKWVRDITETQRADSVVSDIAPRYWSVYNDNVTWPMAWYTVAGMLYDQYADPLPIIRNYQPMKKFMLHLYRRQMREGIIQRDVYGDWCVPPEAPHLIHSKDSTRITDGRLLGTAAYYRLCLLMDRFARISGCNEDTVEWQRQAREVREAFNRTFYQADKGYYANNTMTANLLALQWQLVEPAHREQVFQHVVAQLVNRFGTHIATGVLGTQVIMNGLTAGGRDDLAWQLATQSSYPSWGFMVTHGATTIWELWNGDTAEPRMNSGNHVMLLGDLISWLYQHLAGITQRQDSQGYKNLELRVPRIAGLTHLSASYESVYGTIASSWKYEGNRLVWTFTIPANTTALVYLPTAKGGEQCKRYGSGIYKVVCSCAQL